MLPISGAITTGLGAAGTAAAGLAAAGKLQNESRQNNPQNKIDADAKALEDEKRRGEEAGQWADQQREQARQQTEQDNLTKENQEAFSSQNNLENALRSAYYERRGKRANANSAVGV